MKEIMTKLRKVGIQFYLDDFGTGYSNIERIVELPFDIIKFDRSLTILAGEGERSKYIGQSDLLPDNGRDLQGRRCR